MTNTEIRPITVAVPTSFLLLARLEKTTAPSIPVNTQTVTSIVLFTWPNVSPQLNMPVSPLVMPYKPALKVSKLNAPIIHTMTSKIGMSLATVTILLINAAVSTPFKMR